jgi:ribose 1,5-bisphosphokinase
MSTVAESPAASAQPSDPIGPGQLVLVVGPSGAGKDTLLALVRDACRDGIFFPRRVVTRAASAFEDHDTLSGPDFERALQEGRFALAWEAHGLRYGIPSAIDAHIRAAGTVVCNVSRAIVPAARARYRRVSVVLITAPVEILAARLRARGRAEDVTDRLRRAAADDGLVPDGVIDNTGTTEAGARKLLAVIGESA